jgi:ergothioneine biosynthesis protein EgtB
MDEATRKTLLERFIAVRGKTEELARPLSGEDQVLQSMPSCSPTKWHRAHTTWFFETFVLVPRGVPAFDASFGYLFNSYYEAMGPRHSRPKRGLLSRPSADEVATYRRVVDGRMLELLQSVDDRGLAELAPLVELGLAHEEQHQELILTDILNAFSENPLRPAYRNVTRPSRTEAISQRARFVGFDGGLVEMGASDEGFAFDNERPRHRVFVAPFELASRLVSVGEVKAFIAERGYDKPEFWLSDGFSHVTAEGITSPLYSRLEGDDYLVFSLNGERPAADDEPACHLSMYEADAIARFLGGRLPTEAEWELAASSVEVDGNFLDSQAFAPQPPTQKERIGQMFGDVWEWTRSSYEPYPGYEPPSGALGEYNGKFMIAQVVLRGGSCLTPRGHVRASYRNFWYPETRFQMTGLRIARDI